jgi:hypothetical protein
VSDNFRYPFSFVRNSVHNLFSASRTVVIIVVCEQERGLPVHHSIA